MRHAWTATILGLSTLPALAPYPAHAGNTPYAIVDTGQTACYNAYGPMPCPARGAAFSGQDGQVSGNQPRYRDNGDGTISDLVTGLMWQKGFGLAGFSDAPTMAAGARTGGHDDWRVPNTKELYSLIQFNGATGTAPPGSSRVPNDARPYLDTTVFAFEYPTRNRYIDAQYVTSTAYTSTVMNGLKAFFGVNFADGRIKGYPQNGGPGGRVWYTRFVRGNPAYGHNDFTDNGDGTISDRATGLTWTKADSGRGLDWEQALSYCRGLAVAGKADWRLPNAKELHSIVDYSRSPDATNSPAIDPIFSTTAIRDPEGKPDWPFFWSSTTHLDGRPLGGRAVYVAFGRAQGYMGMNGGPMGGGQMGGGQMSGGQMGQGGMQGPGMQQGGMMQGPGMQQGFGGPPGMGGGMGMGGGYGRPPGMMMPPGGMMGPGFGPQQGMMGGAASGGTLMDVHGAGAQRSSPKAGDESRLPKGHGPQGDIQRIYNYVRCVRG